MLKIYNTTIKKKEEFVPLNDKLVTMYVCGPTVYDYAHLGHAKTYIHFDIILRYLRYLGYKVRYIQNLTDVGHLEHDRDEGEDKIIKKAVAEQIEPMELVEIHIREFFKDMDSLNVTRPNISPRASAHIPEIIEFIQELVQKGFAYEAGGSVYFSVKKFKNYGTLSGRVQEKNLSGYRIEVKKEKKYEGDFALWKKTDDKHILKWPSPWGSGYPGWHIECSVMSMKYLGNQIDIHGGAIELVFPHHENEIAQSEAFSGEKFVHYWVHGGVVMVGGQKMSKSLGNFLTIKELLKKFDAEAVRFFIASKHYRQPIDFTENLIDESNEVFLRIKKVIHKLLSLVHSDERKEFLQQDKDKVMVDKIRQKYLTLFKKAMNDDFNTPVAVASILGMTKDVAKLIESKSITSDQAKEILKIYQEFGIVLGLFENILENSREDTMTDFLYLPREIAILIGEREQARQSKEWEKADNLRKILSDKGFVVEDIKNGVQIKKVNSKMN